MSTLNLRELIRYFLILLENMSEQIFGKVFKRIPLEAIVWIVGLSALLLLDPASENHYTLCPFANVGFDFCPGCGLGRAIALLFRGEFLRSFQTHPLGLFAVIILSYRIFQLLKQYFKSHGKSY